VLALSRRWLLQFVCDAGKGMDPRDAREESADCMMCLVVTGWSDSMLRDMVSRYKKVLHLFFPVLRIWIRIRIH
jgi:hypothetical protein